ncbi:MAG: hypothetical protein M5U25_00475 [Planctomycetota bacterium]|nr:hypothetical protein [Planctomycetota bacterium]
MLIFASSFVAQDAEYKPPRKWTFGSIGIAMRDDLTVYQGGAKDADGNIVIQEKDQLLKWNGKELKTLDDFCRNLYATKPGEIVEVEIASPGDGEKRLVHTVKIKLGDPKQAFKELYTSLDKRQRGYDWRKNEAVTKGGPLREKLWPLVEKHKLQGEWDNLLAAHERELDLWDSYENLSSTDLLLSDPLSAHQWIQVVGEDFGRSGGLGFPFGDLRLPLLRLLDVDREAVVEPTTEPVKGETELFAKALSLLIGQLDCVTRPEDAEEWAAVCSRVTTFVFSWRGEPGFAVSAQVVDNMRAIKRDVASVILNLGSLLNQIDGWAKMFRDEFPEASPPKGVDLSTFVEGEAVCIQTTAGLVAIGGRERNVWKGGENMPAVIVDLGGDDEYVDCGVTRVAAPVQVVIDHAGNDHYRSTSKWGVACGVLGTAIIDDHDGNDTYECSDWGIGAAFGGIGLLIDRKGNDRYLGGNNSIGCAAYGVGGVIDLEGNDLYDSHTLSVGVGQPGGVGFVLDHSGDDRYRCTGGEPSPYGTKGEWFGGGIGCGFGWRTLACGGIGLVVDVKGNDIYDAGEFGLGCGYFMAIGAVRDMEGDDIYHSSRYGLAAAAHAAVGVFMDDKGNDVYEGKTAASIGGTWDIVTGYFYDGGGDDNYRCDGLGLGACAQNGFGIFWDAGGADNYRGAKTTIGNAGNAEYGGGRLAKNFGIFMDTGGGKDRYPREDRKNGSEIMEQQYALFLDE